MTGYVLPNPFMSLSMGTRSRQPMVTDSRSVAAEWGDGLLDAGGDTKRLSTQDADGHASGSGAPAYSPDDLAWANQAIDEYYANAAPGLLASQHPMPPWREGTERLPSSDAAGAGAASITPADMAWAERAIDEFENSCGGAESRHAFDPEAGTGVTDLARQDPANAGVAPGPHEAKTAGYLCCPDCGVREPCDRYCPHAGQPDLLQDLREITRTFEIEPVPAFISRDNRADEIEELLKIARAEEWPAAPRRAVG